MHACMHTCLNPKHNSVQAASFQLQYAAHLAQSQSGRTQADALAERLQLVPDVGTVSAADKEAIQLYLDGLRASSA